jgi:HK97 family phage major capsid protein
MTPEENELMVNTIIEQTEARRDEIQKYLDAKFEELDTKSLAEWERLKAEMDETLEAISSKGDGSPNGPIDGRNGDPGCGFRGVGDLMADVVASAEQGFETERLKTYRRMEEEFMEKQRAAGTGFEVDDSERGGYTLPEGFKNEIWERVMQESNVIDKVFVIPLTTKSIKIPAMGGYDRSGGTLYGGIQFYDEGENDQLQDVRPKFEQINFDLGLQGALTHASDAMLRFSPVTMESFIKKIFADALRWRIEYLLFNGTGAGQPDGVIGHGCAIDTTAVTGQGASTVIFENIVDMDANMWPSGNPEWYFNPKVKRQLRVMSLAVGTGGNVLNWKEELDHPYHEVEHCAALGTTGDIVLGDFGQYGVTLPQGQGNGPRFDTSIHFKFDYAQTSFRFLYYCDGHPMWRTSETDRQGGTYSPFVTLASSRT